MEIAPQPRASGGASLLVPDAPRSRLLGLVALAVTVTGTTLLLYPLREIAPAVSTGVIYLVAVLLLSTYAAAVDPTGPLDAMNVMQLGSPARRSSPR